MRLSTWLPTKQLYLGQAATSWHMQIGAELCVVSRNPEMKTPNR